MKAFILRRTAALLTVGAATLGISATASAQNNVVVQPTPQAAPAPAPAQVVTPAAPTNVAVSPGVAEPQAPATVVAQPVVADQPSHPINRPSRALLMTGLVLFGAPYVASIGIAATSSHTGDGNLYVPVIGPWLDLGARPGCPSSGDCGAETGNKVLLVGDGILGRHRGRARDRPARSSSRRRSARPRWR